MGKGYKSESAKFTLKDLLASHLLQVLSRDMSLDFRATFYSQYICSKSLRGVVPNKLH
jgi:hypothetical protein